MSGHELDARAYLDPRPVDAAYERMRAATSLRVRWTPGMLDPFRYVGYRGRSCWVNIGARADGRQVWRFRWPLA